MRLLAIFIVAALLFAGCLNFGQAAPAGKTDVQNAPANATDGANTSAQAGPEETGPIPEGARAVYLDYNPDEFAKSLAEKKIVFLEFFSAQNQESILFEPKIYDAFSQMATSRKYMNVIGFRVVKEEWEDLALQYGVSESNTHVIIGRDGSVVLKENGNWDKQKLMDSIRQAN
ncbi:Uncharacterised protein [Candidatus Anstonella stagnisolia]|nr:Uncharacterised protein [Candidatus Anstonella stagnisolia]